MENKEKTEKLEFPNLFTDYHLFMAAINSIVALGEHLTGKKMVVPIYSETMNKFCYFHAPEINKEIFKTEDQSKKESI